MITSETELKRLKEVRAKTRLNATQISKRFKVVNRLYGKVNLDYDRQMAEYKKADRAYAFAIHENEKRKRKPKETKPYDSTKKTAAKALKALESLPKELRDKIIADAQDGLF